MLIVLSILVPLSAAGVMLVGWRWLRFQRALALSASVTLCLVGLALVRQVWLEGVQVLYVGGWPAPYGITLVADLFSACMVAITGVLAVAVVPYAFASIDPARERYGFHPLIQVLLTGVCGAFLTGDLFNLYVWFEVMLMASFVLMALNGGRLQVEAATKYVVLNLVASAMFLAAVGLLYGLAGTVNMAHLSERLLVAGRPGLQLSVAALLFTAFGIKAAVFPLFFWLPASYHVAPAAVAALFAGLLTKVGVYALIRVFTLVFSAYVTTWSGIFVVVAAFTMITGVLGAIAQDDMRRVLAFHIVSQIGYMVLGLAIATPLAVAGAVFYIIHHIIVKTNLFLVAGVVQHMGGTARLKSLGGLYLTAPLLAFLFLIPAMSLAGMPPLSGFVAKFAVIRAAMEAEHWLVGGVALLVGILTLLSMTKIWNEAFWKPRPAVGADADVALVTRAPVLMLLPIAFLAAITVTISLGAGFFFEVATRAAEQLLTPGAYVRAVLEVQR